MKKIIFVSIIVSLGILVLSGSVIGVTGQGPDDKGENPYVENQNDFGGFEKVKNETGVSAVEISDENQEQQRKERISREVESIKEESGNRDKKSSSTDSNKNGQNNMLYMVTSFVFGIVVGVIGVVSYQNKKSLGEEEIKL